MITEREIIALIRRYAWTVDSDTGMLRPPGEEAVTGIHLPVQSSDPSTLKDGDVWYNETATETRGQVGGVAVSLGASGGESHAANRIFDADTDTKIQAEESPDEDNLRFDTGGTERAVLDENALDLTVPIKTDIVSEHTPDAGVTVDGVLVKDGEVDGVDVSAHEVATTGVHGATDTPAPNKIPIANGSGKLDPWISEASTTKTGRIRIGGELEGGATTPLVKAIHAGSAHHAHDYTIQEARIHFGSAMPNGFSVLID